MASEYTKTEVLNVNGIEAKVSAYFDGWHRCAYVEMDEARVDEVYDVHGGITYPCSGEGHDTSYPGGIASKDPELKVKEGNGVVGWDYAHWGDDEKGWNLETIFEDAKASVIENIKRMQMEEQDKMNKEKDIVDKDNFIDDEKAPFDDSQYELEDFDEEKIIEETHNERNDILKGILYELRLMNKLKEVEILNKDTRNTSFIKRMIEKAKEELE